MSGVACHYNPWTTQTIVGLQVLLDIALGLHTQMDGVGHDIPSWPLESIHDQMMSRLACHHRLWNAYTVRQCQAWKTGVSLG